MLPHRILGALLFIIVFVFELCPRRSFTVKHTPYAGIAPVPTWRRLCSVSPILFLSRALSVSPTAFARSPMRVIPHATRGYLCAALHMHALLRTSVPTDAAHGALTSPAATRKSERNRGSKPHVLLYHVPPVDLGESLAMQDAVRSPRSSRN